MNHSSAGGQAGKEGERHVSGRHEHHKTITMADIAKAAGVSQGAISSLLNDRDYGIRVSEKTRERVFKVCREMHYIPNDLRAVVRMYPELGDFCFLVSDELPSIAQDPFASRIVSGAMDAILDPSRHLSLARYSSTVDYLHQTDQLPHPLRSGTASKFFCFGTPNVSLFQTILRREFPVVFLGGPVSQTGVSNIVPDYAEASRAAIEYLYQLGHRHIAILAGPFGTTDSRMIELNRGVRDGFEKIGIPIEAQNIVYGDLTYKSGSSAMSLLLERTPKATAMLCLSDHLAAGALAKAQASGVKVPEELSVIGCGDDYFAQFLNPPLTTVHLPAEELGAAAVEELNSRIQGGELRPPRNQVLPTRLLERESCVPPKHS
jgi:DNA-binding LacI/PurR family transcriptional regulator